MQVDALTSQPIMRIHPRFRIPLALLHQGRLLVGLALRFVWLIVEEAALSFRNIERLAYRGEFEANVEHERGRIV